MTLITITKWDANYMNMSMVSETESIMHSHSSVIHYKDQAELETAFNAASAVSSIWSKFNIYSVTKRSPIERKSL